MKKIMVLFLFLFFTSFSFAQLQNIWTKEYSFGFENGQPFSLSADGSTITVAGFLIDGRGGSMAAISQFSANDGAQLWRDNGNNWSESLYGSVVTVGNRIYWDQITFGNDILIKKNMGGATISSTTLPWQGCFLAAYGDSLVIVSGNTVAIADTMGNIVRRANYTPTPAGGMMTLKILQKYLFVINIEVADKYYGTVTKIDLEGLKAVRETRIPDIARCFGDIDTAGNVYFCGTWMANDSSKGLHAFLYAEIDTSGGVRNKNIWYGNPSGGYDMNYENWVNGVSFYDGIVIMGGSIQNGPYGTASAAAYLAAVNGMNGALLWNSSFVYDNTALQSQVKNCLFDTQGNLWVLGNSYRPQPEQYRNFLQKYKLTVTGVEGSVQNTTPKNFSLSQNYPNPFNPTTVIGYQVSGTSHVRLAVYDVLGREVATLVNEEKSAGSYEVTFNASNLPSGMYLYRLETSNGFSGAKKMMLLK